MPTQKRRRSAVRKPKQLRSKVTVAAIVEAATQVLAEHGWAGFNTNVVAARAGVSIGSLYEYFPNKHALLEEIVSDHLARGESLLASVVEGGNGSDDLAALVAVLVRGLVDLHGDDPRLHRVLSSEVPLSLPIRRRIETLRQGVISFVERVLAEHTDTPGVAAQLLVDMADGVIHRWFVENEGQLAPPERMAEELSLMLDAYLSSVSSARRPRRTTP